LIAELIKLTCKELVWRWRLCLNKLNFSKLLEEVEIGQIHRSYKAHHLLGLSFTFGTKAVEVYIWVSRYRVVHNYLELLKRNSASSDVCENERCDLFLLKRLNGLAQFNLRNVSDQLQRGEAALL
jgi:hypothetical protein